MEDKFLAAEVCKLSINRGKLMDRCMLIDKWKDTCREIDRSIFKQIDGLIDRYLDRQINGKSFHQGKKKIWHEGTTDKWTHSCTIDITRNKVKMIFYI